MRVPEKWGVLHFLDCSLIFLAHHNLKMVGLDIPNLLGYYWCLWLVAGYFITECGFVWTLSTAVVNTTCWLAHAAGKPAWPMAGSSITSSAGLSRQPRSPGLFPQVQLGVRTWLGFRDSMGRHSVRLERNGPGVFPINSSTKVPLLEKWANSRHRWFPHLSVVLLRLLQSILSLTLWWTQEIFSVNIHIVLNLSLHGLLIQSIFHFHTDCGIHAGVWVLLLQEIPPLCSILLVSKALF